MIRERFASRRPLLPAVFDPQPKDFAAKAMVAVGNAVSLKILPHPGRNAVQTGEKRFTYTLMVSPATAWFRLPNAWAFPF
jgi:hypothetical protein